MTNLRKEEHEKVTSTMASVNSSNSMDYTDIRS